MIWYHVLSDCQMIYTIWTRYGNMSLPDWLGYLCLGIFLAFTKFSGPLQLLLLARATHVAGEHASGTEWKETMAELASYVQNF